MKKAVALLLALVMVLALCACGKSNAASPDALSEKESGAIEETDKHITNKECVIVYGEGKTEEVDSKDLFKVNENNEAKFKSVYNFAYLTITGKITQIKDDVYGKYICVNDKWKVYYVKDWYMESHGAPKDYSFSDAESKFIVNHDVDDEITVTGYLAANYSDSSKLFVIPESLTCGDDTLNFNLNNIVDFAYTRNSINYSFSQEKVDDVIALIEKTDAYSEITDENQADAFDLAASITKAINDLNPDEKASITNGEELRSFTKRIGTFLYKDTIQISDIHASQYVSNSQILCLIDFVNKSEKTINYVIFNLTLYDINGTNCWTGNCTAYEGPFKPGQGRNSDDLWWELPVYGDAKGFGSLDLNYVEIYYDDGTTMTIEKDSLDIIMYK